MSKKSVKQVRRKHSDEFRRNGVTDNTYYRWRKEFGGIRTDQAKRLKELEKENYPTETIIRRRPGSRSGSATLDVTLPDGTYIKVHLPR